MSQSKHLYRVSDFGKVLDFAFLTDFWIELNFQGSFTSKNNISGDNDVFVWLSVISFLKVVWQPQKPSHNSQVAEINIFGIFDNLLCQTKVGVTLEQSF